MRDGQLVLKLWREAIRAHNHPETVTWLPHQAMVLRDRLYYRPPKPCLTDCSILTALQHLPAEEPGVLMVIGTDTKTTFATLLMDPFGSDDEVFLAEQNFYLFLTPYVEHLERVESHAKWFWKKYVLPNLSPRLSSLDYAFSQSQARAA
ncbi:hypothetical protein FZO89_00310 [Luteimonas viscosa]|uniref:Uncharacterized protein n=1 Tax=Luteimonas viscosa TaxID=1132694 RepID=A0A5D4XJK4_9GAMM|nr:hypothetical protein [Luteimonas viscosa]TYT24847.1 hypothetical protein FZO89_00310 [Luteimonas viscosa]